MVIKNSIIAFNLLFLMFCNFNSMCMKREAETSEGRESKKIKVEEKEIDIALMVELPLELIAAIKDERHISFSVIELANEENATLPATLLISIVTNKNTKKSYAVPYMYYRTDGGIRCEAFLVDEKLEKHCCDLVWHYQRHTFDGVKDGILLTGAYTDYGNGYTVQAHSSPLDSVACQRQFFLDGDCNRNGNVISLALCDDKFVYGTREWGRENDICSYHINIGYVVQSKSATPTYTGYTGKIITLKDQRLDKSIYLGKNTWLGLDKSVIASGDDYALISFWLDEKNEIKTARQKLGDEDDQTSFYDIDVDRTIKTKNGFMPRIALLSTNGDVYETDLTCFETPRMFHTTNILPFVGKINNVKRLVYDNQQCSIVYQKDGSGPLQYLTWPAQFNVKYAYSLAKEMYAKQQKIAKIEKQK